MKNLKNKKLLGLLFCTTAFLFMSSLLSWGYYNLKVAIENKTKHNVRLENVGFENHSEWVKPGQVGNWEIKLGQKATEASGWVAVEGQGYKGPIVFKKGVAAVQFGQMEAYKWKLEYREDSGYFYYYKLTIEPK